MEINHIALYVNDLEATKDFFIKYFRAQCNTKYHNPVTNFSSYFLKFDNDMRLELMNIPDLKDQKENIMRLGYIHIAFSIGSKATVDQLKSDGWKIISGPRITGDGYYESCILGPEGNVIEIVE